MAAGRERAILLSHSILYGNNHNALSDQNHFFLASLAAGKAVIGACQSFSQPRQLSKYRSEDSLNDIWALGTPWDSLGHSAWATRFNASWSSWGSTACLYLFPSPDKEALHFLAYDPSRNIPVWLADTRAFNFGWDIEKSFSGKWQILTKSCQIEASSETHKAFPVSFGREKGKSLRGERMSHGIDFPEGSLGFFQTKSFLTLSEQGLCETQQFWLSCYFSVPAFITLCLLGLTLPPLKWLSMWSKSHEEYLGPCSLLRKKELNPLK